MTPVSEVYTLTTVLRKLQVLKYNLHGESIHAALEVMW